MPNSSSLLGAVQHAIVQEKGHGCISHEKQSMLSKDQLNDLAISIPAFKRALQSEASLIMASADMLE